MLGTRFKMRRPWSQRVAGVYRSSVFRAGLFGGEQAAQTKHPESRAGPQQHVSSSQRRWNRRFHVRTRQELIVHVHPRLCHGTARPHAPKLSLHGNVAAEEHAIAV